MTNESNKEKIVTVETTKHENNEREIHVIGKFAWIAKTKIHLSFSFVELENSSNSMSIFLFLMDCSGVC